MTFKSISNQTITFSGAISNQLMFASSGSLTFVLGGIIFNSNSVQNIGLGNGNGNFSLNYIVIPIGITVDLLKKVSCKHKKVVDGFLNC